MGKFKFTNNPEHSYSSSLFVANLQTVIGKKSLLRMLSEELDFPNYFGQNWDALWDCITDLEWIDQKDIILVHSSLPVLNEHDLKIYLEILDETITFWDESDEHSFEVIFPTRVEKELKDYQ